MTGAAAVLVRPPVPERTLSALRFIRTRPGEVLSVIVLSDGSVENRFIHVDTAPTDRELERLHNMLSAVVTSRPSSSSNATNCATCGWWASRSSIARSTSPIAGRP
jgi:transcriptional regulator of heat shock response